MNVCTNPSMKRTRPSVSMERASERASEPVSSQLVGGAGAEGDGVAPVEAHGVEAVEVGLPQVAHVEDAYLKVVATGG